MFDNPDRDTASSGSGDPEASQPRSNAALQTTGLGIDSPIVMTHSKDQQSTNMQAGDLIVTEAMSGSDEHGMIDSPKDMTAGFEGLRTESNVDESLNFKLPPVPLDLTEAKVLVRDMSYDTESTLSPRTKAASLGLTEEQFDEWKRTKLEGEGRELLKQIESVDKELFQELEGREDKLFRALQIWDRAEDKKINRSFSEARLANRIMESSKSTTAVSPGSPELEDKIWDNDLGTRSAGSPSIQPKPRFDRILIQAQQSIPRATVTPVSKVRIKERNDSWFLLGGEDSDSDD